MIMYQVERGRQMCQLNHEKDEGRGSRDARVSYTRFPSESCTDDPDVLSETTGGESETDQGRSETTKIGPPSFYS